MDGISSRSAGAPLRRKPKQDRSRERVDEILKVATQLIGEKGVDHVTMREIASAAGGPIASLYQYFPNKSAIISTIYARFLDVMMGKLVLLIEDLAVKGDPLAIALGMFDAYYGVIRDNPGHLDILIAVQADKTLMSIDIAASWQLGDMFFEVAKPMVLPERHDALLSMSRLLFHLSHSAVRMALYVGGEEEVRAIANYKTLIITQWTSFVRS